MGQRHQIFVRVNNPLHTDKYISDEDKKKARKIFGRGKTTIIALHHQWLYGASAVVMIKNIMDATLSNKEVSNKTFDKNPYLTRDLDGWIEEVMMMFQTVTNPKFPRGIGVERMHFLNEMEPDMRTDCTGGDNNDGITIIDAIERKYCMMNIFPQYKDDEEYDGIYTLPSMQPVSGREYVKAYYPDAEHQEHVDNIVKEVEGFELLTMKDLKKLFPNNFKLQKQK
jgi:hypothetical protein